MPHIAAQIIRAEHTGVAAVLRSMRMMMAQGPEAAPERFFDVLRAMLFYIDEFPEKLHHPKESELLFPLLAKAVPELAPVIRRLDDDHAHGEAHVRELQHLLLAWELIGESRRAAFADAADEYVAFYLDHMRVEEAELLPAAERALSDADWVELDRAFESSRDPMAGGHVDPSFDRLFTRIVLATPAPIGVGPEWRKAVA
jgi:hemerythrin-like domain-containing protein